MEDVLGGLHDTRVELSNGKILRELGCADDVVCPFGSADYAQRALARLARAVDRFGMHLWKVLLQYWATIASKMILSGEELTIVSRLSYLGICLVRDGVTVLDVNTRMKGSSGMSWCAALVARVWNFAEVERSWVLLTVLQIAQFRRMVVRHGACNLEMFVISGFSHTDISIVSLGSDGVTKWVIWKL